MKGKKKMEFQSSGLGLNRPAHDCSGVGSVSGGGRLVFVQGIKWNGSTSRGNDPYGESEA